MVSGEYENVPGGIKKNTEGFPPPSVSFFWFILIQFTVSLNHLDRGHSKPV